MSELYKLADLMKEEMERLKKSGVDDERLVVYKEGILTYLKGKL